MLDRVKMKRLRLKLKLSQAKAGERASPPLSAHQWSNIERDGTGFDVQFGTVKRIAVALGVKAKELLK